jgi:imidazolonepropionase-like amidohydrolase
MRTPSLLAAAAASLALSAAVVAGARAQTAATLGPEVRQFVSVDAPVIALTNVRVVDGTGAPPATGQTLLIQNGRISAVGPSASLRPPAGAEILDLAGHTVIPGIVGMHNHTFYTTPARQVQISVSAPRLYLGTGVTTIRTTGSYHPYSELNLKRAVETGRAAGPRMHITGPYITGPTSGYMTGVATPEDARRVVGYWADEGATWFKAYTTISREDLRAAIEEAHRRGLKFTGHLCSVSYMEAVELGIDNLEHGLFTNSDYVPGKEPDLCPSGLRDSLLDLDLEGAEVQATFRAMIDNGVAMTSTLAVYEISLPNRPPLEDRFMDALAPEMLEEYMTRRRAIASAEGADSPAARVFRKAQDYEVAFVRAGGLLAAGVDPTGNGGALPGFGDQRNFELLVEAGFTPIEAIQIMTLNGARILGVDDELGSIAPGKLADLVVIQGDPIADPALIRNVRVVFKDGVGYDSQKLIDSVRGVVGVR